MKTKKYDFKKNRSMILHRGYCADCYYSENKNEKRIIKIFQDQKLAEAEYEAILSLKKVDNYNIICPEILNFSQNIIIMKFETGRKFYEFLKNKKNFNKASELFFEFGKFLAEFHNKNRMENNADGRLSLIHGDLNSKNLLFLDNGKLFIMDPKGEAGDIYNDISEFILNFYPFNFLYEIFLFKNKDNFIENFLRGYASVSDIKITEKNINDNIVKTLEIGKDYLSKEVWYNFKKFIINLYINHLIAKIKNGKLQVKLY